MKVTDELFDRPLPQAIEHERAVLGSILVNADMFSRVSNILDAGDFFSDPHRMIFAAMQAVTEQHRALDFLSLKDELRRRGQLDGVGGSAFVSGLTDEIPDVANVETYARTVKEKSQSRELVNIATETLRRALDGERPTPVACDAAERLQLVQPIDATRTVLPFDEIAEGVRSLYNSGGLKRGASTGWPSLDGHYTVAKGAWTLISGIPGHGKSGFIDHLAINLAQLHDSQVVMFSAENYPPASHVASMIEKFLGEPFNTGPSARMSAEAMERGSSFVRDHFRFIDPAADRMTLDAVLATASALSRERSVNVLTIDPWNELHHDRAEGITETEFISVSLTKIRRWARKHDAHVFLVVHPAKMMKDRDSGNYMVPTPYDASGSAHWRNKADYAITIYRNITPQGDDPTVQIHVQKVRRREMGQVGLVELRYDKATGAYADPKMIRRLRQVNQ